MCCFLILLQNDHTTSILVTTQVILIAKQKQIPTTIPVKNRIPAAPVQNPRNEVALPFASPSVLSQQSNVMQSGLLTNSSFHNCNFTFNGKQ